MYTSTYPILTDMEDTAHFSTNKHFYLTVINWIQIHTLNVAQINNSLWMVGTGSL